MTTQVKCKSGLTGWQCRLHENYRDWDEFEAYSNMYGLHERLGCTSAEDAWAENPLIQGSTNPKDFCKVDE